ncbi:MAG: hypothetical protein JJU45_03970 [Acidimicrobiia bacterium]|nr:hypothetical protein [Acidimicrobiia bacterium]
MCGREPLTKMVTNDENDQDATVAVGYSSAVLGGKAAIGLAGIAVITAAFAGLIPLRTLFGSARLGVLATGAMGAMCLCVAVGYLVLLALRRPVVVWDGDVLLIRRLPLRPVAVPANEITEVRVHDGAAIEPRPITVLANGRRHVLPNFSREGADLVVRAATQRGVPVVMDTAGDDVVSSTVRGPIFTRRERWYLVGAVAVLALLLLVTYVVFSLFDAPAFEAEPDESGATAIASQVAAG